MKEKRTELRIFTIAEWEKEAASGRMEIYESKPAGTLPL